jgi:predicted component of type VI protein secretion system
MRLRYTKPDGTTAEFVLTPAPITIGRSPEADVVVPDERVSRIHCGVRLWDGEYTVRDLKSTNGTFVNGRRVETTALKPGDVIRVGSTALAFEADEGPGANTAIREIGAAMDQGKGYHTILKELVGGPASEAPAGEPSAAEPIPVAEVEPIATQEPAPPPPSINPMLTMPQDAGDAGDAGVAMGPDEASRPPPTPSADAARKKLRIVVKKKFTP